MPYQRRYNNRYRNTSYRRPRKPYVKPPGRRQIYGSAISQLASDVNRLRQMVNVEYKYHDFNGSSGSVTSSPIINCVNLVNQGDTDSTHDGSMFRMKSLAMNGYVKLAAAATNPIKCRVALVLDCDSAAATAAPSYDDIYDTTGSVTNRMRNLANRSRFVILKSFDFVLNPQGTEGVKLKYYKDIDLKCIIEGTASETNLRKNGLYLVWLSDTAITNLVEIDVNTRIRFIDN